MLRVCRSAIIIVPLMVPKATLGSFSSNGETLIDVIVPVRGVYVPVTANLELESGTVN